MKAEFCVKCCKLIRSMCAFVKSLPKFVEDILLAVDVKEISEKQQRMKEVMY